MSNWKTACKWVTIISLLFLAIPIRVKLPEEELRLFNNYIKQFNKSYVLNSEEYFKRFTIFKESLTRIKAMNSLDSESNMTAKYGLTKFSDLTEEEFTAMHLDKVKPLIKRHQKRKKTRVYGILLKEVNNFKLNNGENSLHRVRRELVQQGLPLKIDWRERGVISEVADQGLCGACWAYSTIQVAEAMFATITGNLTTFSVQQMIDCATNGNYGCKGGDICGLLSWLTANNVTIMTEKEYPIIGRNSECHSPSSSEKGLHISKFTCMSLLGMEDSIIKYIALHGPVAVAVNALSWQNYLGGIIKYHCPGEPFSLNHAVQLIGYDLTSEVPYFVAKNSWGKTFGLEGYLHLGIGENTCGLANEVSAIYVA